MHSNSTIKKLRAKAVLVNDIEYCLVKVAGEPHSFVQIANAPGMTEQYEDGSPVHSLSGYFISPTPCILFKHGNFDLFMRMWEDSLYS